jgi:hypothetical protein
VNRHRRSDDRGADAVLGHLLRPLRILRALCGKAFFLDFYGRNSRILARSWRGLNGLAT